LLKPTIVSCCLSRDVWQQPVLVAADGRAAVRQSLLLLCPTQQLAEQQLVLQLQLQQGAIGPAALLLQWELPLLSLLVASPPPLVDTLTGGSTSATAAKGAWYVLAPFSCCCVSQAHGHFLHHQQLQTRQCDCLCFALYSPIMHSLPSIIAADGRHWYMTSFTAGRQQATCS